MAHKSAEHVEMPKSTVWPLVLSLGVTMLMAGIITHWLLSLVGAVLLVLGLRGWIAQMMPGVGHVHEAFVPPAQRAQPIRGTIGKVEQLRPDRPGYRFRIPEKIHPISAGVKGGIVGGLVMPIPAIAYGIISGNGPWFPINLLGGMVLPIIETMSQAELQKFSLSLLVMAIVIHVVISTSVGLVYGVLLPTLPQFPGSQLFFGGLILPLMWSGICYGAMGTINPPLEEYVDWRFFIASQIVFGVAASLVVESSEKVYIAPVGGETPPAPPVAGGRA